MSIVNSTFTQDSKVVFSADSAVDSNTIREMSSKLSLRFVNLDNAYESAGALGEASFVLYLDSELKLELWNAKNPKQRICVDFESGEFLYRLKTSGKNQPLAKAVGVSKGNAKVLDATGGLGGDAFILASLGCMITLVERNPIVHALLENGLNRALKSEITCKSAMSNKTALSEIAKNIRLIKGNALDVIHQEIYDVIYLDPMYPDIEKTALAKKEMQMLDLLVGSDEDQLFLFEQAMNASVERVVIKRPKDAAPYRTPTHSYETNSTRYDMYQKMK